jgi:hypothetical protein
MFRYYLNTFFGVVGVAALPLAAHTVWASVLKRHFWASDGVWQQEAYLTCLVLWGALFYDIVRYQSAALLKKSRDRILYSALIWLCPILMVGMVAFYSALEPPPLPEVVRAGVSAGATTAASVKPSNAERTSVAEIYRRKRDRDSRSPSPPEEPTERASDDRLLATPWFCLLWVAAAVIGYLVFIAPIAAAETRKELS